MIGFLRSLQHESRHKQSGKRKRYVHEKWNLDLTYITSRIIAMSVPVEDFFQSFHRNHCLEISAFLREYHNNHYMIFNMSEFLYDTKLFDGNVVNVCFPDHYNPPLALLLEICEAVHNWLLKDDENIVVLHCRGGKGRTGVAICSYLIYSLLMKDTRDSVIYFALTRFNKPVDPLSLCQDGGINSPSQVRYVSYVQQLLEANNDFQTKVPVEKKVKIKSITFKRPPTELVSLIRNSQFEIEIVTLERQCISKFKGKKTMNYSLLDTFLNGLMFKDYETKGGISNRKEIEIEDSTVDLKVICTFTCHDCSIKENSITFFAHNEREFVGDVVIRFVRKDQLKPKEYSRIGLHTSFIPLGGVMHLSKNDIDGVHRRDEISERLSVELNCSCEPVDGKSYSIPPRALMADKHSFFVNNTNLFSYERYLSNRAIQSNLTTIPVVVSSERIHQPLKQRIIVKIITVEQAEENSDLQGKFIKLKCLIGH
ncbi:hypothetical protein ABK040_000193 [Willaertia magna]